MEGGVSGWLDGDPRVRICLCNGPPTVRAGLPLPSFLLLPALQFCPHILGRVGEQAAGRAATEAEAEGSREGAHSL